LGKISNFAATIKVVQADNMGIVIRQGFKFTVVTYAGVALGAFNILYLFPRFLKADEIGLRELLIGLAMGLAYFAQLAMNNVLVRFFPYFKDESRQHNGLFLLSLIVSAAGYLLVTALFYLFTPFFIKLFEANAQLVNEFMWAILPLTLFTMLNVLLENWARLHFRISLPAVFRELVLRVFLTVLVVLYGSHYIDFIAFIRLLLVGYGLNVLMLVLYLYKLKVFYLNPAFLKVPGNLRKDMVAYAVWMMIGGAGVIINERIDGIMLAWLASLSFTGIYAISFFIGTIIEMPRRGISQIAGTLVSQYWKDGDFAALNKIYKQSSLNQYLLGGTLFLLIWSNIDAVFMLIPNGTLYSQGKYVVFFIGLSRLVDMASGVNNDIIQNSPYYRFNLILIVFLGVISFTTNYLMIPLYGLTGAAAGSTLSILLFSLLKGSFIWHKLKMQPFEKRTLYVSVIFVATYYLAMLIPASGTGFWSNILHIGFRSALILFLMFVTIWRFKLSDELHGLFETYAGKVFRRPPGL